MTTNPTWRNTYADAVRNATPEESTLCWHEKGCMCPDCQQQRLQEYYANRSGGMTRFLMWAVGLIIGFFLLKWGYTEYWISQHCTMVLGTRVCQ